MVLTVVTATHNCIKAGNRERLIRCVESIARLKTEHEHLIYDGASTDGTVELLRELEAKMTGLKVVSEPDAGIYNALNKGVRDAKGKWFYVLGADDYIVRPEVLDSIINGAGNGTQVIITPVVLETMEGEMSSMKFTKMRQLGAFFNGSVCCHQGELMWTTLVRELGADVRQVGFDERYRISADMDMFLRAHLKAVSIQYIFRYFACFHEGGCSTSNADIYKKEAFSCVVRAMKLNQKNAEYFSKKKYFPPHIALRLIFHRDVAVRIAAMSMLVRRIVDISPSIFRPIITAIKGMCDKKLDTI